MYRWGVKETWWSQSLYPAVRTVLFVALAEFWWMETPPKRNNVPMCLMADNPLRAINAHITLHQNCLVWWDILVFPWLSCINCICVIPMCMYLGLWLAQPSQDVHGSFLVASHINATISPSICTIYKSKLVPLHLLSTSGLKTTWSCTGKTGKIRTQDLAN